MCVGLDFEHLGRGRGTASTRVNERDRTSD